MAKKPTRLRFTEDDLADSHVSKAAGKADKAADKAEKAVDKITRKKHRVLKDEKDIAAARKAKLRFGKAEQEVEIAKPSTTKQALSRSAIAGVSAKAHKAASQYSDDNVGVQAVNETTQGVETAVHVVDHAAYSHKLKAHAKADKLVKRSDKANVNVLYEKFKKDNPDAISNPISKWRQKQLIKKEYAASRAGKSSAKSATSKAAKKAAEGAKSLTEKIVEYATTNSKTIIFILLAALIIMVISGSLSSCTAMFNGGTQMVIGTSFTADDEDIIGANEDYTAMETALRNQISNIERTNSGYDEYRYDLAEINHNPYELTAYLTVLFEDFTHSEVQGTLQSLFTQQYKLTLREEVEIRTRTETRTSTSTDPVTGETSTDTYEVEVEYEYYILNLKLVNNGLNMVIGNSGLSEDDMERYRVLLETQGNRPDIFEDDIYATPGGEYTDYDIPGEALTDERFAKMIKEAEKYLGYPYVWGEHCQVQALIAQVLYHG